VAILDTEGPSAEVCELGLAKEPNWLRNVVAFITVVALTVPRELFAEILDRIQRFGVPPPLVQRG
jgi:hypothetical protein